MDGYAFLADGFEEVEAIAVVDILLRAGVNIKLVSVSDQLCVTGAHGIQINAQCMIKDIMDEQVNLLFLPGGMPGTKNLADNEKLRELLIKANERKQYIAAICAAPSVLGELGILKGKKATCFPGFEDQLKEAEILLDKVVVDGNIITSRGMGTAIDLGLKLVEIFCDKDKAMAISKTIQYV